MFRSFFIYLSKADWAERIVVRAGQYHNFVRIDMEDTPYTDRTIRAYRQMRERGHENMGLVKGAYLEPGSSFCGKTRTWPKRSFPWLS